MKRILSLALVAIMVLSILPITYAAEGEHDFTRGTEVVFEAANNENYTITVPAKLNPGQSGPVTLAGEWPTSSLINVTSDPTVTLTNNINNSDQAVLDVAFPGISETGNNTKSLSFTQNVSVENISNAIFGVWQGIFYYNVSTQEVASNPDARMRLAITTPSSNNVQNPTNSPTSQYLISGFASAANGIKQLTIGGVAHRTLNIIECDYIGMGTHSLYLDEMLTQEELEAILNKDIVVTASDGQSFAFSISYANGPSNELTLSDKWYNESSIISQEIAQSGVCHAVVTFPVFTTTVPTRDITSDGNWSCSVELPTNSAVFIKAILEDNNANVIDLTKYVTYQAKAPFEYGVYRAGAIEEFIKHGEEADIQSMFLRSWDEVSYSVGSFGDLQIKDSYYYNGWGKVDLIIPDNFGATRIVNSSFKSNCSIGGVYLPEGITTIEEDAFEFIAGCRLIYVPASVTSIGENVADLRAMGNFVVNEHNPNYCSADGSLYTKNMQVLIRQAGTQTGTVSVPSGVTRLAECSFYGASLSKVVLPDTVTNIGVRAFTSSSLSEAVLSKNITDIGSSAFYETRLVSIEIPAGVKTIKYSTFQGCDKLTSITLHKGLESIDVAAFWECDSLDTVYFYGTEEDWNAISIVSDYNAAILEANIVYLSE